MYVYVVLLAALVLMFYLALIFVFIRGWERITYASDDRLVESSLKPSVVICCKNESHHLPALIDALKNQSHHHFELIWVNDHSTDDTQQILEASLSLFPDVHILSPPETGKKKALREGILAAKGDFIITTDADCVPGSGWIASMVNFQLRNHADIIIGPVKFYKGTTLFHQLQQLEFATLVGSGMGAAGAGMPVFCNAANMAFTKKAWIESMPDLHQEELSGDDVFLLHSIKKRKGSIAVLKAMDAVVLTSCQKSLQSFIRQRERWASKSSKYRDFHIIVTALLVVVVNLLQLGLLVAALVLPHYWPLWFTVFLLKFLVDALFLLHITPFFQLKFNLITIVLLAFLYPFYTAVIGVLSFLKKNKHW